MERDHLQEWIVKQPDIFGEDLLIIQKEFSGFEDTQERLDLLALDRQGALVIIENKLDDSGRDVVWQALKYASYCSSLSKVDITKIYQQHLDETGSGARAEERISDFMEGQNFEEITLNQGVSQRIILVAAKFRKEVTSTVLWLMNFGVELQCFRATLFAEDEALFLNVEQIIPTQDAEDYTIGMAKKARDDIADQAKQPQYLPQYKEFWSKLIPQMNATDSNLYQNKDPYLGPFLYSVSGIKGVGYNLAVTKKHCRAELYINRPDKSENQFIFDRLYESREAIEDKFGGQLEWEKPDETRKLRRVWVESAGNVFDSDQWNEMIDFMVDAMCRLEKAIKEPLQQVGEQLKSGGNSA